jgi:enoyl-CoA hydratase/carnithine racemase
MPLLCEKKDHVAVLTLSRPQARNAWGDDYNQGLREVLPQLEDDREVRVVVLTGDEGGGAFSAGADLKNPKTHSTSSMAEFIEDLPRRRRHQAMNLLSDFPKPLIAAVNGYAVGIGCIVTYCCDLIVASERAEWRLPQVGLGILPAQGGTVRLARWVGRGQAMKLAMGFPLSGEEAYRIGLAQWLVPHDELMTRALEVGSHCRAAAARRAPRQGIGRFRPRRPAARGGQRRSLPLHGARADRGQEGEPPGLARAQKTADQGTVSAAERRLTQSGPSKVLFRHGGCSATLG